MTLSLYYASALERFIRNKCWEMWNAIDFAAMYDVIRPLDLSKYSAGCCQAYIGSRVTVLYTVEECVNGTADEWNILQLLPSDDGCGVCRQRISITNLLAPSWMSPPNVLPYPFPFIFWFTCSYILFMYLCYLYLFRSHKSRKIVMWLNLIYGVIHSIIKHFMIKLLICFCVFLLLIFFSGTTNSGKP